MPAPCRPGRPRCVPELLLQSSLSPRACCCAAPWGSSFDLVVFENPWGSPYPPTCTCIMHSCTLLHLHPQSPPGASAGQSMFKTWNLGNNTHTCTNTTITARQRHPPSTHRTTQPTLATGAQSTRRKQHPLPPPTASRALRARPLVHPASPRGAAAHPPAPPPQAQRPPAREGGALMDRAFGSPVSCVMGQCLDHGPPLTQPHSPLWTMRHTNHVPASIWY